MSSIEPFLRLLGKSPLDAEPDELKTYEHVLEGMHLLEPVLDVGSGRISPKPAPPAETPVASPTPVEESTPMNLPSNIQKAVDEKIQAELRPVAEKLLKLKASIDAFSEVAKTDAERRVSNSVLVALGQEAVAEDPKLATVTQELREALTLVGELVGLPFVEARKEVPPKAPPSMTTDEILAKAGIDLGGPPLRDYEEEIKFEKGVRLTLVSPKAVPDLEAQRLAKEQLDEELFQALLEEEEAAKSKAPPPPASEQCVTAPPAPKPAPRKPTSEKDIAHAKRLVAEVEALKLDMENQHPTRLEPLLQAQIAEVRLLLTRLGPDQEYHRQKVTSLISLITALKNEGGVESFVKGLAYGSTGDWEHIAVKSRQKVAKYDNDVSRSEHAINKGKGKSAPAPKVDEVPSTHKWPDLPRLHKLVKPILLAGGILVPDKLKSVQERFGLEVEWHEIDHDNPRASQALVTRIRGGKVGAIILLEGVMRHSTFKSVTEACNLNGVPYAMGDKAGIASLHGAFAELERQLAA